MKPPSTLRSLLHPFKSQAAQPLRSDLYYHRQFSHFPIEGDIIMQEKGYLHSSFYLLYIQVYVLLHLFILHVMEQEG